MPSPEARTAPSSSASSRRSGRWCPYVRLSRADTASRERSSGLLSIVRRTMSPCGPRGFPTLHGTSDFGLSCHAQREAGVNAPTRVSSKPSGRRGCTRSCGSICHFLPPHNRHLQMRLRFQNSRYSWESLRHHEANHHQMSLLLHPTQHQHEHQGLWHLQMNYHQMFLRRSWTDDHCRRMTAFRHRDAFRRPLRRNAQWLSRSATSIEAGSWREG